MMNLPDSRRYQDDHDFQEVRVDMVDQSTFVFGRVSAAVRFARKNAGQVIRFTLGDDEPVENRSESQPTVVTMTTDSLFDDLLEEVGVAPSGQVPLGGVHPYNIDALLSNRIPGVRSNLAVGRWGIRSTHEVKGWRRSLTALQKNSAKQIQATLELRRPVEYISVSAGFEGDLVVGANDLLYIDVVAWLAGAGYERFDIYEGHPERLEYFRLRESELKMAA